tara:strand:- start:327 stop:1271 length:945 start_codon:yes stop_codon:yes gene_type:complete
MHTYKQIFKQAIKIAWFNPSLWIFGLLVALLGNAGEIELILGSAGFGGEGILLSFWQGLAEGGLFTIVGIKTFFGIILTSPFYFFSISLIMLTVIALSILTIWLVIVSQTALITKIVSIINNQELKWQKSFSIGLQKFWSILALNFLARFFIWFLLFIIAILASLKFSGEILVFIVVFNILLFLIIIISFILKYAIIGVVLKNWKFKQSLGKAWKIFIENWLLSLEIALIISLIFLLINSLMIFFISNIIISFLTLYVGFLFGLILLVLLAIMVFVAVQVLLTIFHWATWVIVFELLDNKKHTLVSILKSGFRR